jgi:hypothetical protein
MQTKTDRPMKKFSRKEYGNFGDIFDMEKVFENGYIPKHKTKGDM